jgi:hypothetical protein
MCRMLLISDLHMHSGDPTSSHARSYLSSDNRFKAADQNPLSGIYQLIKSESLEIDWIVCAGDIADRNNHEALRNGWAALAALKTRLKSRLFGTVGNHDVDSRRIEPEEKPNSVLRALTPLFPTRRHKHCNDYWTNNLAVVDDEPLDARLVIVNSCAFHGYKTSATVDEHEHGRITRESLDRLRFIARSRERRKNILLVHHHLRPHPIVGADISVAIQGERLLDILRTSGQQWLVIHGHEHLSYLGYEGDTAHPPIIFSAGSIASTELRRVPGRFTTNQLYYIHLPDDSNRKGGTELFGEIRAWDWLPLSGWQPAHKDSGIPHYCGFGLRGQIDHITEQIAQLVCSAPTGQVGWHDVWLATVLFRHLVPADQVSVMRSLKNRGIIVTFGAEGVPIAFAQERHP